MSKNNLFNNLTPKYSRPLVVGKDATYQRIRELEKQLSQQPPMIMPPPPGAPPGMSPMPVPPPHLFPQFLELQDLLGRIMHPDKKNKP